MTDLNIMLASMAALGDRQPRDPDDEPAPYRDDGDPDEATTGCDCVPYCKCAEQAQERADFERDLAAGK